MASRLAQLPQYVCCSRPVTFRGHTDREEEFHAAVSMALRCLGANDTTTTSSDHVARPLRGYVVTLDQSHIHMLEGSIDLSQCLVVVIGNLEQLCEDSSVVPQVTTHGSLAAFTEVADLAGAERCAAEWFVAQVVAKLYEAE